MVMRKDEWTWERDRDLALSMRRIDWDRVPITLAPKSLVRRLKDEAACPCEGAWGTVGAVEAALEVGISHHRGTAGRLVALGRLRRDMRRWMAGFQGTQDMMQKPDGSRWAGVVV